MSEFDLVDITPVGPGATAAVRHRTLVGKTGIPVLAVTINPAEDRLPWPSAEEIPGLVTLEESQDQSPFELSRVGDVAYLTWCYEPILESWQQPHLFNVDFVDLPGLKHRPEEVLPVDFRHAVRWDWKLTEEQRLYGLGQRSMPLERRGTAPVNWTTDEPTGHSRSTDPLYQAHPLLWGVTGKVWWAVFFQHSPYTRFDLGQERHDRMRWLSLGSSVEFHVHAANSPAELHASLRQTWLPPTAPPFWSFGFHQSRWGYRNGSEVSQLVDEFQARKIPLDVIHLDIDHMENYRSFSFSKERFPDAKSMLDGFNKKGVRTVTIIDPGLRFDPGQGYEPLDEGLAGNHFLKSISGAPVVGYCWPDEALFPDFSRQRARDWWAKHAAFYLNHGVSGLWIDMNEPAIFDRPFWQNRVNQLPMPLQTPGGEDGRRFTQAALHNLYGSHMSQATHGTWAKDGKRPWILTRSGFTGVGRYAWAWMGDNTSWWEHLAMSIPQLASMGLVGSPFVGVDVGGFFGHCTADLYSAWIEASVIYPFMRAHSALGTRVAHPWSFGEEVEKVARTAIRLRYRLLPYLYGAAMAQTQGDVPLLRPMFFDYPDDQRFATLEDQVMIGPHLMAAPFLLRGQNERLLHLPEGEWYDFHTGQKHSGGGSIAITRRPGLVPLFAPAGAIIPLAEGDIGNTDAIKDASWTIHIFPGSDNVTSTLYWDEGDGWGHEQGRFAKVLWRLKGDQLQIESRQGELSMLPAMTVSRPTEDGWETDGELRI